MADNIFEILIRYGLDKSKATEAASELKKLRDETTATGKEGVKQEQAVEEATKKTFTSKKQLKDMVKQLGNEFPILGQLGRLALNPIVLATAAVVGGFQLMKLRVDELTRSLGGIQMPDFKQDAVDRLDKYASRLGEIASAAESAKTKLSQLQQDIDDDAAFWKSLGIDVGTGPAQAKAAAAEAAAKSLYASGAAKQAAGFKPLSAEDEKRMNEAAALAAKDISERQSRLGDIDQVAGLGAADPRRIYYDNRFRLRYGNVSYDEARGIERSGISSSQGIIDFSANYKNRVALGAAGSADIAEAGSIIGQNVRTRNAIRNDAASAFSNAAGAIDPARINEMPGKMIEMFQAMMRLIDAMEASKREVEARQRVQNRQQ